MAKTCAPMTFSYYDPKGWVQILEDDGRFFNDKVMVTGEPLNGMTVNASHYPKGFWKLWHTHKFSHAVYVIDGAELTEEGDVYGPGSLVWDPEGYEGGHGPANGKDCKFLWITNKDESKPLPKPEEKVLSSAWNVYNTDWEEVELPTGNIFQKLMVVDDETGFTLRFARLPKEYSAPLHYNTSAYGMFVIEGSITAETGGWKKNDFVWFPIGHRHELASEEGALLLVVTATTPELRLAKHSLD